MGSQRRPPHYRDSMPAWRIPTPKPRSSPRQEAAATWGLRAPPRSTSTWERAGTRPAPRSSQRSWPTGESRWSRASRSAPAVGLGVRACVLCVGDPSIMLCPHAEPNFHKLHPAPSPRGLRFSRRVCGYRCACSCSCSRSRAPFGGCLWRGPGPLTTPTPSPGPRCWSGRARRSSQLAFLNSRYAA